MQNTTLCFLVRDNQILLAMKKRGFGQGRWNGVGGKVEKDETLEQGMMREATEEIGATPITFDKVAELTFRFPAQPTWDQLCHVYFCSEWRGEPCESEEMAPKWFSKNELPFSEMWPDDEFWLPRALRGEMLSAEFVFNEDGSVISHKINNIL